MFLRKRENNFIIFMNTNFTPKRKKWPWVLFIVFLFIFAGGFYAYSFVKNLTPEKLLESDFVQKQIIKQVGDENSDLLNIIPDLLGFEEPKTYLFLFLNNTELRPGGGFIGSYATMHFDKGQTSILQMGGTENISKSSSSDNPPGILKDKLGVDKWYFRDSNWSPDFAFSSEKTLEFYKNGNNVGADDIDGVVGVTTDVLEDLMLITGPFVVDGIEFTSQNVIEKLEYEVEYAYDDKGLEFHERKDILETFMLALMNHVKGDIFKNLSKYKNLALALLKEKNIVIFSLSEKKEDILTKNNWGGRMNESDGDYLLWVDANLAALKTDYVIKRDLYYSIDRNVATIKMLYKHTGKFDWRTTRYLSYARVYVPSDSLLLAAKFGGETIDMKKIDGGTEGGKQWFGTFISIEPGEEKELEFEYELPVGVLDDLDYSLLVQKQIGMNNVDLHLNLNFKSDISSAEPAEEENKFGDNTYNFETELTKDLEFDVKF
ncbi:MAG: hypothetical protein COX80_02065 [Candidatus Magasanikbacteria bacterium CG_4_10_14_0_2_um_filter_33_14]|uniref:DUF4012 domain-containing protein n=1 Tax=Candidatus Magasanikbacteria bacterium CG_4_10_14_0_2_um_filter_33_14 TaxID=1974636 RepID=A0A2M7VAX1_9BACT|nr:MAG: hypothetical protein COX80_02065 [Candidatus Magasanikbacteria bacterium CG_4_10_14_0_2_um_filter_33_14]